MPSSYDIIKNAIETKKPISAIYRQKYRELCPHVLGTKDGRYQALFYQFGGESTSGLATDGSRNNWRCMFLDELTDVTQIEGEWHSAPNHSRPQSCVDQIDCEVSY